MGYLDDFKQFILRKPISDPDSHPDTDYTKHSEEKRFQTSPTGRAIRELEHAQAQQDTSVTIEPRVPVEPSQQGSDVFMSNMTTTKDGKGKTPPLDKKDYRQAQKPTLPTGPIDIRTGEKPDQMPVLSFNDIERAKLQKEQNRQSLLKQNLEATDKSHPQPPPTLADAAFNLLDYPGHVVRKAIAEHVEAQTGEKVDPEKLSEIVTGKMEQQGKTVTEGDKALFDLTTKILTDPINFLPVIGLPTDAYKAGGRAIKGAYEGLTDASKLAGVDLAGERGSMYGKELTTPISELGKTPTFEQGGALTEAEQKEYKNLIAAGETTGLTEEQRVRLDSLQAAVNAHNDLGLTTYRDTGTGPMQEVPHGWSSTALPGQGQAQLAGPPEIPVFYSPTERALEAKMPKSAAPAQVLGIIKSAGIPQDEAKWMDLEGFMRGKEKVSKDEVLNYVKVHRFQLEEVVLGQKDPAAEQKLAAWDKHVEELRRQHDLVQAERERVFNETGADSLPEDAEVYEEDEFGWDELEEADSSVARDLRDRAYDMARESEEEEFIREWENGWDRDGELVEDESNEIMGVEDFRGFSIKRFGDSDYNVHDGARYVDSFSDYDDAKRTVAERVLAEEGGVVDGVDEEEALQKLMDEIGDEDHLGYDENGLYQYTHPDEPTIYGNADVGYWIDGDSRRNRTYESLDDAIDHLREGMWDNFEVSDSGISYAEDEVFKDFMRDVEAGREELPEGVYVRGVNYDEGFQAEPFRIPPMPRELRALRDNGDNTHYKSYALPGAKNYREFLLKVPNAGYSAPHFGEEAEDIMLHFRTSERDVVVDGANQRTLLVEEIQSDLHQQGRQKGYRDPNAQERYRALSEEYDRLYREGQLAPTDHAIQIGERLAQITDEMNALQDAKNSNIPDLPFKKDWSELAVKRIIRLAAEEGYDRIAWTTGRQQAKRYYGEIFQKIDHIRWSKNEDGTVAISGAKDQQEVPLRAHRGDDPNAIAPNSLQSWLGEAIAEDIRKQLANGQSHGFVTPESAIEIGGAGMKGYYDFMLPKIVEKYTKKWGSKLEDVEIEVPPDNTSRYSYDADGKRQTAVNKETVHSIPVSPQMAEAVLNNPQSLMGSTFQTLEEHFKTLPKMVQEHLRAKLPPPKQFKKLAEEGGYVAFGPVWMISRAILGSIAGAQFGDEENAIQNALIGAGVGALASPSMIASLAESIRGVKTAAGTAPKFAEAQDLQAFLTNRSQVPRQEYLSPLDLPSLEAFRQSGGKIMATPDYKTGYMLSKEGDLQSVFNGGAAGMGKHAVKDAIKRGARSLDAFDGYLPDYYKQFGFVESGRAKFDPNLAAPGVEQALGGQPDVVFMQRATPISEFAAQYKQLVEDARRGVRHDADVMADGDLLVTLGQIDEEYIKNLYPGTALNVEQTYAIHKVLTQSGKKLLELSSTITDDASAQEFLKALWAHGTLLDPKRLGVMAEAGRSERIYGVDAPVEMQAMKAFLNQFSDVMEQVKVGMNPMMVAEMVKSFKTPEQMAIFAKNAVKPGLKDAFLGLWINSLLSGPHTHVANAVSNGFTLGWGVMERQFAPIFGGDVKPGEAAAMIHGVYESFGDALRAFWEVFKGGDMGGKVEMHHTPSFQEAGLTGVPGHALDYISAFFQGMGGRALAASDAFFKAIAFRAEARARALREAYNIVNAEDLTGKAARERVKELYQQYMTDIPEDIAKDAEKFAAYVTFTQNLGPAGAWLQEGSAKHPVVKLVVPFVKAPINIFKYANERTPWGIFTKSFVADMKAGGARADLAMAKWSMGAMTMGSAALLAMDGIITGGGPDPKKFPDLRKDMVDNGWQPYSINISAAKRKAKGESTAWQKGDQFIGPFSRVEPIGSLFGMAADYVEIMSNRKADETTDEMAHHMVAATIKSMSSKTFIKGLSQTMLALTFPDEFLDKTLDRQAVSLIPVVGSSLSRKVTQQIDPIVRHAEGFIEELKKQTPGLSSKLSPELNRWGEEVYRQNAIGPDIASPFYSTTYKKDPVVEAIMKNKVNIPAAPETIMGLPLSYEGKIELHRIIAKEVTKGGLHLHESLEKLINSKAFKRGSTGPDGRQALLLRARIEEFTARGEMIMLKRHPELKQALKDHYKAQAQRMKSIPTVPDDRELQAADSDMPDFEIAGN